jgi:hypothetical protein
MCRPLLCTTENDPDGMTLRVKSVVSASSRRQQFPSKYCGGARYAPLSQAARILQRTCGTLLSFAGTGIVFSLRNRSQS